MIRVWRLLEVVHGPVDEILRIYSFKNLLFKLIHSWKKAFGVDKKRFARSSIVLNPFTAKGFPRRVKSSGVRQSKIYSPVYTTIFLARYLFEFGPGA